MHEDRPVQLYEMMARLGIEPSGNVLPRLSLRYATAIHRCEVCPSKQACRHWLDQSPERVSLAPHFCPDADILFELQMLSFPKITSGRIDDAARPRPEWLLWRQTVGLLDATARLSVMPSACALDCNTPHTKQELAAGAAR